MRINLPRVERESLTRKSFFKGMGVLAALAFVFGSISAVGARSQDQGAASYVVAQVRNKAENIEIGSYGEKKTNGNLPWPRHCAKHQDRVKRSVQSISIGRSRRRLTQASATCTLRTAARLRFGSHSKAKSAKPSS